MTKRAHLSDKDKYAQTVGLTRSLIHVVLHLSVSHKELYIVWFDYTTPLYILSIAETDFFNKKFPIYFA